MKKGYWIWVGKNAYPREMSRRTVKCSNCGKGNAVPRTYCPNCGYYMKTKDGKFNCKESDNNE